MKNHKSDYVTTWDSATKLKGSIEYQQWLTNIKEKIAVEFALRGLNKPIGISEFTFTEILPENLKGSLPTVEEIEKDLNDLE